MFKDDVALATLARMLTMAVTVAGDSVTSREKLTVTLLSSAKKPGSELLFKFC